MIIRLLDCKCMATKVVFFIQKKWDDNIYIDIQKETILRRYLIDHYKCVYMKQQTIINSKSLIYIIT